MARAIAGDGGGGGGGGDGGGGACILSLSLDSAEAREALDSGRLIHRGRTYAARAVAVLDAERTVQLELFEPGTLPRAGLAAWAKAARPISLTATFTPALAAVLYGVAVGWTLRWPIAIAGIVAVVLLQVAINLFNDVEDHHRLIDLPGGLGGAQLIQQGVISARAARRVAWMAFSLGLLAGLPALFRDPLPIAIIGLAAAIGTLGYSNWPLGLKYRAFGDLAVLALCGPGLTLGISFAAFGRADSAVVGLGVFFGAAAIGILHCNNWQDVAVDRARGAVTVAGLLGSRASKAYLVVLYLVSLLGVALAWWRGGLPLWTAAVLLLPLPLVVKLLAAVLRADTPRQPGLELLRIQAAQLHLALGVAACIGLALALFV